jgi:hypothetical protein
MIERPDEIYEALIDLHRGLDEAESRRADARLILLMAAEIGSAATLKRLIEAAREAPRLAGIPEDQERG